MTFKLDAMKLSAAPELLYVAVSVEFLLSRFICGRKWLD